MRLALEDGGKFVGGAGGWRHDQVAPDAALVGVGRGADTLEVRVAALAAPMKVLDLERHINNVLSSVITESV